MIDLVLETLRIYLLLFIQIFRKYKEGNLYAWHHSLKCTPLALKLDILCIKIDRAIVKHWGFLAKMPLMRRSLIVLNVSQASSSVGLSITRASSLAGVI